MLPISPISYGEAMITAACKMEVLPAKVDHKEVEERIHEVAKMLKAATRSCCLCAP